LQSHFGAPPARTGVSPSADFQYFQSAARLHDTALDKCGHAADCKAAIQQSETLRCEERQRGSSLPGRKRKCSFGRLKTGKENKPAGNIHRQQLFYWMGRSLDQRNHNRKVTRKTSRVRL